MHNVFILKMIHIKFVCRYAQNNIFKPRCYTTSKNPFVKTWETLSNDLFKKRSVIYPEHADVVIIGGGFIGASIGYWLKTRTGSGLSVVILEKDLSYAQVQNNISLGTLTQHFSLPENIQLAQYSADFLRNIKLNLNSDTDIQYRPNGNLILASERYVERLEQNVALQKEFGVKNELLTAADIKEKYPWINTSDVKLGCISTESEGFFNPGALLKGLVLKCSDLGVKIVDAQVIGFNMEQQRDVLMEGVTPGGFKKIDKVIYKTKDNEEYTIKFAVCILAASGCSGEIAELAQIGVGDGLLKIPLPIENRVYQIYKIQDENTKASINTPAIMDTSGLWLQRNRLEKNFLCGCTPLLNNSTKEMVTEKFFEEIIMPSLSNRFPTLQDHQIKKLWTEVQDCNTYDETGILGPHPYHSNLVVAAGFGKLGCQHAPGIGRAVAESIIDGYYSSIDLTRFGFDRLLIDKPLVEFNVY